MDITYIGFFGVLGCFVLIAGFRFNSGRQAWDLLKQHQTWRELQDRIGTLTLDDIRGLPEPTHYVLNCVLTSRPGLGKPQAVPAALDHLAATLDAPLRMLRSLSYASVLLGLLSTVGVLACTFWGIEDITKIQPSLLGHVYSINAFAIFLAAILYIVHIVMRWRADALLLTASQTLGRLQAEIPEGVDPHLVAALEAVGRNFMQWGEEIYARHRQDAQVLVQEMQGLGQAIQGMVQSMVAARRTEEEGLIPLLRTQDEKIELLSQRLDDRFRELAEPIRATMPFLQQWQQRLEELGQLLEALQRADLPGKTEALALATRSLEGTVDTLPQAVREKFAGIKEVLGQGLQDAVRQGWQETVAPVFQDLTSRLASLLEEQQTLLDSVKKLPQAVAQSVTSSWQKTVEPTLGHLADLVSRMLQAQQSLDQTMTGMGQELSRHVAAGVQPLVHVVTDLTNRLAELGERLSVLSNLPHLLPRAVHDSLSEVPKLLATSLPEDFREWWRGEIAPQITQLSQTIKDTLEEQQRQRRILNTLDSRLADYLENWETKLAEKMTVGLQNALSTRGDGYLRDIASALHELEKSWGQMSKTMGGSSPDKDTGSWRFWRKS